MKNAKWHAIKSRANRNDGEKAGKMTIFNMFNDSLSFSLSHNDVKIILSSNAPCYCKAAIDIISLCSFYSVSYIRTVRLLPPLFAAAETCRRNDSRVLRVAPRNAPCACAWRRKA